MRFENQVFKELNGQGYIRPTFNGKRVKDFGRHCIQKRRKALMSNHVIVTRRGTIGIRPPATSKVYSYRHVLCLVPIKTIILLIGLGCSTQSIERHSRTTRAAIWPDLHVVVSNASHNQQQLEPLFAAVQKDMCNLDLPHLGELALHDCKWKALLISFRVSGGYSADTHRFEGRTVQVTGTPTFCFVAGDEKALHVISNYTSFDLKTLGPQDLFWGNTNEKVVTYVRVPNDFVRLDTIDIILRRPDVQEDQYADEMSLDGTSLYALMTWQDGRQQSLLAVNSTPPREWDKSYKPGSDRQLLRRMWAVASLYTQAWYAFSHPPSAFEADR